MRYGTTGSDNKRNVQPILVNHYKGRMALAHNGNLTNSHELRQELESQGSIFQTTTDSEVIAYIIVQERLRAPLHRGGGLRRHGPDRGGLLPGDLLPHQAHRRPGPPRLPAAVHGPAEGRGRGVRLRKSCALDAMGASFERDILPGEIVVADKNGVKSDTSHCGKAPQRLCVFEFIYFARPDSVIDGSSVHMARQRAGAFLALEHPVQADIVIGVPDSGLDAAMGYARQSGIPYGMGFIKNKYIGRTFISPTQAMRENEVNIKLNPIRSVVEGKRVVLIDDSIVRGTTCRRTIDLLRQGRREGDPHAGQRAALCVRMLLRHGHRRQKQAHRQPPLGGGDRKDHRCGFSRLSQPQDVVKLADNTESGFCTACFGGGYPTAVPAGWQQGPL